MISGIYQLTFPDGSRYIGKSINIEDRWAQHIDKMRKGTAAKAMQAAWNRWGTFDPEVIIQCHPDHIDIMEESLIARLKPELNGTRPADRLPGIYGEDFDNIAMYLDYGTVEHIQTIISLKEQLDTARSNIENLEEANEELSVQRNEEELRADIGHRIADLLGNIDFLEDEVVRLKGHGRSLERDLEKANRSWWQKLFS